MSKAPFPIDPALTSIALAYGNERFVADDVLPRTPVGKEEFKYNVFSIANSAFTIPDTKVGRKGKPGEVEFGASEATSSTDDYGLELPVPYKDIENAAGRFDPLGRGTEMLSELVALDREKRVADLVFATGTYAAANRVTPITAAKWSAADTNPVKDVLTVLDGMVMRPNIGVMGRSVYTCLIQHPAIVAAYNRNGSTGVGKVPLSFIADLFELDQIVVGEGWYNSAKPGKTPTMVRLWGKSFALMVRNKNVSTVGGVSFGYTAEWGTRVAAQWDDKDIGLRGGVRVRVGESLKELIIANDLGYLFDNVIV